VNRLLESTPREILYLILCLVIPPIWGVISYWLFSIFGKRLSRGKAQISDSPDLASEPCRTEPTDAK
jgi:hypothetical protein